MKIPDDVLGVLADPRTVIAGDRVQIPFELGKNLYERVNKLLKTAGGRWDGRKAVRAHVFDREVEEFMRQALLAGEFVSDRDLGWFPTPPAVVHDMLEHAGLRPGMTVLEPSAGTGAVAGPAAGRGAVVDVVELDERRAAVLHAGGYARLVHEGDFLTCVKPLDYAEGFQRVLMNPPFHEALAHVGHAFGFLGEDALLVAVLPENVTWHTDRVSKEFRELVDGNGGELLPLPADAFKPSGANVRSVLAVIPTGRDGCTIRTHAWHRSRPRQLALFG